jgi:hypothetical protein
VRAEAASPIAAGLLLLPACFLIETILGGPFGIYGGVPVRFLLLFASGLVLLFGLLFRKRIVGAHRIPLLSIVGFLLFNGLWIAIVPVLTGTDMHWALREPHAFIVLGLVAVALALFRPDQLTTVVHRMQRLVVWTALVLAVFQVSLWVLGMVIPAFRWAVPVALGVVFRGATDQFFVGEMPDGFFRVFWISTLWCLLAFFWVPLVIRRTGLRRLCEMLLLLDLFVAYSRGIWIGLLVGLLAAAAASITRANAGRMLARFVVGGAAAALTLVGILAATGALDRGIARFQSTTSRKDESIGARVEQAPYLLALWYEHPFVGSGYGAYSHANVRSQDAPYSYEHMPYALLAKLGLLGAVGSGVFFAGWGITAWGARRRAPAQVAAYLGACVALLVSEMTNPMVLNFVSMTIFACLLLQWAMLYGLGTGRPALARVAPPRPGGAGYLPVANHPEG